MSIADIKALETRFRYLEYRVLIHNSPDKARLYTAKLLVFSTLKAQLCAIVVL